MRLRVYLPSRTAVSVLGSVLDAAMAAGHGLQLIGEPNAKDPLAPGDLGRWAAAGTRGTPDVVLGLAGDPRATWGVAAWWDNLAAPPVAGQTVGYLSAWHRAQHAACWPAWQGWIRRQPVIGWTLADHRRLLPPPDPHETVLFTMKRRIPEPWRRSPAGRWWYARRVWAWRRRAAPRRLVLKTRAKHGDPWWLPLAGQVVDTTWAYPSTTQTWLTRAHTVGHFTSGVALEARLFPHLAGRVVDEAVPLTHLAAWPGAAATYRHMAEDPLDRIITHDDMAAGARVVDALTARPLWAVGA